MGKKNSSEADCTPDVPFRADGGAGHAADQVRNTNSRRILGNPELYAQFIRDNLEIPELADVRPEDIEDVSERYQMYLGIEFEADTVKKIRLRNIPAEGDERGQEGMVQEAASVYLISLVEHKSRVDHNVAMQLLRYIVCIWDDYAREMEKEQEGITKQKGFRYPPILPVVYYEGRAPWSADMRLSSRILMNDVLGKYMPDFTYQVVRIHDYSNEELIRRGDALSLIMMMNKIQSAEDFTQFLQSPPDRLDEILENTEGNIREIIKDVMYGLLMKMKVPVREAKQYIEMIEECRMGYLFENMEEIDIQAERRKSKKIRQEAEEARREAEEAQQEIKEARREAEEAQQEIKEARREAEEAREALEKTQKKATETLGNIIKALVLDCQRSGCTKERTIQRLAEICCLTQEEAEAQTSCYWQE